MTRKLNAFVLSLGIVGACLMQGGGCNVQQLIEQEIGDSLDNLVDDSSYDYDDCWDEYGYDDCYEEAA